MCHKTEPEAIRERLHLGHRNHLASRAAQHHNMRVVDHHALRGAVRITHSIGEKHLAIETLKGGIDLKRTACASNTTPPRRSVLYISCRPLPLHAARCRAASPRRARSDIGP